MAQKTSIIREGQAKMFSADGNFAVRVVNGEARVIPATSCWIPCTDESPEAMGWNELLDKVVEADKKENGDL